LSSVLQYFRICFVVTEVAERLAAAKLKRAEPQRLAAAKLKLKPRERRASDGCPFLNFL